MDSNDVRLVNNLDFLEWASVTPNPVTFRNVEDKRTLRREELPDDVKNAFLTDYGAQPFDNVEDLKKALKVLFYYRWRRGLEVIAVYDLLPSPDLSSCSSET